MSVRTIGIVVLAVFCLLCGGLVIESGVLRTAGSGVPLLQATTEVQTPAGPAEPNQPQATATPAQPSAQIQAAGASYGAVGGTVVDVNVAIGSVDPAGGFKYRLVLDSKGAAIRSATFSEFDASESKTHEPLTFLSPVEINGRVMSMATRELTLLNQGRRLRLDALDWNLRGTRKLEDGAEEASFEATIVDPQDRPVLKLTKTYRVYPDNYLLDMTFQIENLGYEGQKLQYVLTGPVGLEAEGLRNEMRKVVAGFRHPDGQVVSSRIDMKGLAKADTLQKRTLSPRNLDSTFLWAAAVNKYFAAIVVPGPNEPQGYASWGTYYNPDGDRRGNTGDETLGLALSSLAFTLNPAGQGDSTRTDLFQVYLGPKDKGRFDKNPLYKQLGFVETIDFMACCCPSSIINPLAFGILGIMNWMHGFWPHNYGIVIIILVFVMRLLLHPVTKKSQIAMHRMSKLAPRAEEIKKKYGDNKAEMNRRLMELYREQGASPIMGMLPMFVQMPIWIALWSAIYTSIDLRGAAFLPVWITDLSAPDALLSWTPFAIPLLGWHLGGLNLLPILMGVAFYLQQKLMPTQAGAATNPQMAQQQKMMNIMMPLLFPLMLYNAPSGVNLYIMSSTFAGVIEQYVIKKHIREKEEAEAGGGVVAATSKTGGKVKKKRPKPFFRT